MNWNETQSWENAEHLSFNKTINRTLQGDSTSNLSSRRNSRQDKFIKMRRQVQSQCEYSSLIKCRNFSLEFSMERSSRQKQLLEKKPSSHINVITEYCDKRGITIDDVSHNLTHEQHLLCECNFN
jgi:hypothetical protein